MPTSYRLRFIISNSAYNDESLRVAIASKCSSSLLEGVDIEIKDHNSNGILLEFVCTDLEKLDKIHSEFNKSIARPKIAARIIDDVGDDLRKQGYIVCAECEQALREFIHNVTTAVLGFDWWDSWSSSAAHRRAKEVAAKGGELRVYEHQLEQIDFEQLVLLVTKKRRRLSLEEPIIVNDLVVLLDASSTFDEFKQRVNEAIREISLWDSVFSRFFSDKKIWDEVGDGLIKTVIPNRNKIMHHRPFHAWDLKNIQAVRDLLVKTLKTALTPVEPEQEAIKKAGQEWVDANKSNRTYEYDGAWEELIKEQMKYQNILNQALGMGNSWSDNLSSISGAAATAWAEEFSKNRALAERMAGISQGLGKHIAELSGGAAATIAEEFSKNRALVEAMAGICQNLGQHISELSGGAVATLAEEFSKNRALVEAMAGIGQGLSQHISELSGGAVATVAEELSNSRMTIERVIGMGLDRENLFSGMLGGQWEEAVKQKFGYANLPQRGLGTETGNTAILGAGRYLENQLFQHMKYYEYLEEIIPESAKVKRPWVKTQLWLACNEWLLGKRKVLPRNIKLRKLHPITSKQKRLHKKCIAATPAKRLKAPISIYFSMSRY